MTLNFGQISPPTPELSALARLKKMMYNVVNTLAPTFLIGSSSLFQVTRTTSKSGQSSNLRQIGPRAAELAALDRIEKFPYTYNGKYLVNTLAPSFLIRSSSVILAGNEDMRESLDEFKFRRICNGVTALD